MRIDERVRAAVVAGLLAYAALTVAPLILGGRAAEPFSELGVLGPGMRLGDYPREVEAGGEVSLYLFLGNHEGRLTLYRVEAKLGDRSADVGDEEPYLGPVVYSCRRVLGDGSNCTLPVVIRVGEAGLNRRLVFELSKFDPGSRGFVYDGVWTQLWLNVTGPP